MVDSGPIEDYNIAMIEAGHLRAMQAAAQNAQESVRKADLEEAAIAGRQLAAITEIQQTATKILTQYGVPDVSPKVEVVFELREHVPESANSLDFGDTLRRIRREIGLAQRAVGKNAGIDDSYLSKIESGIKPIPTPETLKDILEGLGLSDDDPRRAELVSCYVMDIIRRIDGDKTNR